MKKYKLTKSNLTKFLFEKAVIFEIEGDNMKIVASCQIQGNVIPNVFIGDKTMSPSRINFQDAVDAGCKTFSI